VNEQGNGIMAISDIYGNESSLDTGALAATMQAKNEKGLFR
jgi:RecA/RadA recombinase